MEEKTLLEKYQERLKSVEDSLAKAESLFHQLYGQKLLLKSLIEEINNSKEVEKKEDGK